MYIKKIKNNNQNIKVVFYTKTQIIKELEFKLNSSIKEIFDYFRNNIRNEGYSLKSNYKMFKKKIEESDKISKLIEIDEKNDILLEGELWIEVEKNIFLDDENDEIFRTILQPKLNPFELIEYTPSKSKIKFIECSQDFILFHALNKFTKESAFCNSNNSLFISGGEVSCKAINNFWIIDKNDYKIIKLVMPFEKKNHSMLYIPDNFIFVAGGNSLESFLYDIEKQVFIKWANMNKKHFQPALFLYGDYVYAFSALNSDDQNQNFFERTNLTSKTPKWEKIFPKFENVDKNKLVNHYFALSKSVNGDILFIGGEKNNNICVYNPIKNTFSLAHGNSVMIPFWDKSFYKISKKYSVSIPLNFCTNYKLGLVNKETQSLIEIICDKKTGKVEFKLDIEKEKNNYSGNIYIQSLLKNIKNKRITSIQIGFNPRSIIKKNKIRDKYIYKQKINNNKNKNNEEIKDKLKSKNYKINRVNLLNPELLIDERDINKENELNKNEINIYINKSDEEDYNNNYNDEDITKEEHIFIGDLNGEDEDDNKVDYKTHSTIKKPFLYISNSVLGDQIISRQLIKNDNDNDNEDNMNKNSQNDFEEEETLSFNYGCNENEENEFSRTKTTKHKKCLYIQLSSIEDQITNREVNVKTLKKKENSKPYIRKKIEQNNNMMNSARKNDNSLRYFNYENEILMGDELIHNHNRLNTEGNEILKRNFNL